MLMIDLFKQSKVFYFFIVLFSFFILAKSIFGIILPSAGIVILALVPLLFLDIKLSLCFIFYLLPFSWFFPGYIILFLYIIIVYKCKEHNKSVQFIGALLIIILELLHLLTYNNQVDWIHSFSPLSFIALFFYLLFYQDETINYSSCIRYYCIGSIIAILLSYLSLIQIGGLEVFLSGVFRSGTDDAMSKDFPVLNANSAAFLSIVPFSCLLYAKNKLELPFPIYIILLITFIVLGALSFSRTFMILTAISIILYICFAKVKNKKIIVLCGIVGVFATILAFPVFVDSIVNIFSERFNGANIETAGGRTDIFASYNKWLLENYDALIWGVGINYYYEIVNVGHSTHCGLQQIIVCTGFIGLFILCVSFYKFFKINRTNNTQFQAIIPFIICLAFDQSIQFYMPQFLMFPFIVSAYLYKINS